jgi:hypothetical protein
VTLDLTHAEGSFAVEWFLPQLSRTLPGARPLQGDDYEVTTAPYTGDAVLYINQVGSSPRRDPERRSSKT